MTNFITRPPCADNRGVAAWNRLREQFLRNEDGQSLVEFALCLPPLFLLMTGLFAFGIAASNYMVLTNATNVAAMQLAISAGDTLDPCSTVSSAVYAAAPNFTQSTLGFTLLLNGTTYTGPSCRSSSTTTGAAGNVISGKSITVTVTYPCNLNVYKANNFPNCVLTAKTAELVQ
jgi:Flp pilus assembly protein TadG